MKKIIKTKLLLEQVGLFVIADEMGDKSCSYLSVFKSKSKKKSIFEITFNYKGTKIESICAGKKETNVTYIYL